MARACLEAGANVLNLTGTEHAEEFFGMAAVHDAAVILCYVQGKNVREVGDFDLARTRWPMMEEFFARQIEAAASHGMGSILIDPGLGFYYRNLQDSAVRVRHQMTVFLNTFRLRRWVFQCATRCRTRSNILARKCGARSRFLPCWRRWAKRICSARTKFPASRRCWKR